MLKSIDLLKFFFCLCVIAIHCHTLSDINPSVEFFVTQGIFKLAVPFFFVASGYFLGKKVKNNSFEITEVFKRYICRLFVPLSFFSLVNIVLEFMKMSGHLSCSTIIIMIVQRVIFYPFGALWFVQACIVGALLLYPFAKRNKLFFAMFISFALYLWALVCNNYFFLVQGTHLEYYIHEFMRFCLSARNGIFVGFIYLTVGYLVAIKNMRISNILFSFTFVAYVVEIILLKETPSLDDSALYVTQLLVVPAIFIKALDFSPNITNEQSLMLRHFSVGMYLLHRPILLILDICCVDYIPRTAVVCIVCAGICYLVHKKNGFAKKILF